MHLHQNNCILVLCILGCVKIIHTQKPLCSNVIKFHDYGDVKLGGFEITLDSSERENYVEVIVFVANTCEKSLCALAMAVNVENANFRYGNRQPVPYTMYFRGTSKDAWVQGIALRGSKECKVICRNDTDVVNAKSKVMKHALYLDGEISSKGFSCNIVSLFVPPPNSTTPVILDETCGVATWSTPILDSAGHLIKKESWPWLAAIYHQKRNDFNFICGGTIVSRRVVLSAALCFHDTNSPQSELTTRDVYVMAGLNDLNDLNPAEFRQYDLENILKHPEYSPELNKYDADIAMLITATDIIYTPLVRPACIWDDQSESLWLGEVGTVVGWGRDQSMFDKALPKSVQVNTTSDTSCEFLNASLSLRNFCASPCDGDSGGGFFMKHSNVWKIRGIISSPITTGDKLCMEENLVVYADVSKYVDWIKNEIRKY